MSKMTSTALYKKWIADDSNFKVENGKLFCSMCLRVVSLLFVCKIGCNRRH